MRLKFPSKTVLLLACFLLPFGPALKARDAGVSFAAQVDQLKGKENGQLREMIAAAEQIAAGPIFVRSYSLEDMRKGTVDGKCYLNSQAKAEALAKRRPQLAETFALATSDVSACRYILSEEPFLAAVYRLTGSPAIREHLVRQLEEVATWNPFQRPGWTAGAMTTENLPKEGDGVWLATGTIIQGLALTLEILPPDTLPAELKAKLDAALERELKRTAKDWIDKRPWYVKQQKANSNQWIVPASGLVIACAYLGPEKYPAEYELGVKALAESFAQTGADGSMSEGFTYGFDWSSGSLLLADRFVRIAGKAPFAGSDFPKNFPRWAAMVYQPAESVVNSFDGFGAQRKAGVLGLRKHLSRVAAITQSEELLWLLNHVAGGPSHDFFGLLTLGGLDQAAREPQTAGLFAKSHMFIWRSSWAQDASGLWMRGGDAEDFHDHWDRGHVNLILRGRLVLIEAGTPAYSDPAKKKDFDSVAGHNVLQVGGELFPPKQPAPITVERQSPEGGAVSIEAGASYGELSQWKREVAWTCDDAVIKDHVQTRDGAAKPMLLRWHLASAEAAQIEARGKTVTVTVPAGKIEYDAWIGKWENDGPKPTGKDVFESAPIRLELSSDVPLTVRAVKRPDHTLKFRRQANPHTVIEVAPAQEVGEWNLRTDVSLAH